MNPEKDPLATTVLNLPVFDIPRRDHSPSQMTWEEVMDQTEPQRQYYMEHYDTPEKRLRTKNPEPFRMHSLGEAPIDPTVPGA